MLALSIQGGSVARTSVDTELADIEICSIMVSQICGTEPMNKEGQPVDFWTLIVIWCSAGNPLDGLEHPDGLRTFGSTFIAHL